MKLGLLLLLPVMAALAGVTALWSLLHQTRSDLDFMAVAGRQQTLAEELAGEAATLARGDTADRQTIRTRTAEFETSLAALQHGGWVLGARLDPPPAPVRDALGAVGELWRTLRPRLEVLSSRPPSDPDFQAAYRQVRAALQDLKARSHAAALAFQARAQRLRQRTFWILAGVLGFELTVFGSGVLLTRRYIVRPILRARDAARQIASGNFSHRLASGPLAELATLAAAFNEMAERIQQLLQTLELQRRHSETIIATVPLGLALLRQDLTVLRGNRAFAETLGLERGSLTGRSLTELIPAEELRAAALQALASQEPAPVLELQVPGADGAPRSLRVRLVGTRLAEEEEEEEEEEGLLLVVEDWTQRQQLQAALRQSEAGYRALVQEAPYGIFRCDAKGRFLSANPALVEMLGYESESQVLALDLASIGGGQPGALPPLTAGREGADRFGPIETRWTRQDGSSITVQIRGRLIPDPGGGGFGIEAFAEDVSERRALEEQLRQAQKMEAIGQLAGGLAHDLNNLLTAILASAELLRTELPGDSTLGEEIEAIKRAVGQGTDLTRKLLAFSRRQPLNPTTINLPDKVDEFARLARRLLREDIEIVIRHGSAQLPVRADTNALEQILINLATNARDAMPSGGTLAIQTGSTFVDREFCARQGWGEPGQYAVLTVSDTGVGMDAATQRRIFEPFFSTKPPGQGTGLGLSTVYGLVKQQKGYIQVYSEPGHGSTFTIYLPLAPEAAAPTAPASLDPVQRGGSETVLLVEDNPDVARAAKRALERHGYTVLQAGDGEEALALCRSHGGRVDLVISDMVMPRMGGLELFESLRREGLQVPMLFTSGYTARDIRQSASLPADVCFLAKPWTLTDLLRLVRQALDRPKV